MSQLSAQQLSLTRNGRPCLQQINLQITQGELVGLIGPNGAGKSTLLQCLAGLIEAQSGQIQFDKQPLMQLDASERGRRLGYLAQQNELHWPLTVQRLVLLGRTPHLTSWQRPSGEDMAAVERAMQQTDIQHLAQRDATQLSGGEKSRVLLARLLAVEPEFLLADEPTAALDPAHQLSLMQMLQHFTHAGGAALVVLHDLTLASRFCDRILMLDQGKLVADGPPLEIMTPERLAEVYGVDAAVLDHPQAGLSILPWGIREN